MFIDPIPARTRRLTPEEVEEVDRQLLKVLCVLARIKEAATTPADQAASAALFRALAAALQRLDELTMGRGPKVWLPGSVASGWPLGRVSHGWT